MIEKLAHYLNLDSDVEEYDRIHETITKDVVFKGTNLWILVFAIIVASVGLNMNSTAVIIGAMLISPLMGPINGMGYSLATYNFPLFRIAVKNFTFAVGASLLASTAYFAISPVSTAHSELLARTSPTIYDVLIAFFGGLAGIVAISSRHKGNVIPGVAIATALMPPLCTAGYGLATWRPEFFLGALYLFTINTVFIALSSVAVSQLLKFPIRTISDETQKRRINRWITAIIVVTITPSVYFGYGLVKKERFMEEATRYIRSVNVFEGNVLLDSDVAPERARITLTYGGSTLDARQQDELRARAAAFGLDDAEITIRQGFAFDAIGAELSEQEQLSSEIQRLTALVREGERSRDSLVARTRLGATILAEVRALQPRIDACAIADTRLHDPEATTPLVIVVFRLSATLPTTEQAKVASWLRTRLATDDLLIHYDLRR